MTEQHRAIWADCYRLHERYEQLPQNADSSDYWNSFYKDMIALCEKHGHASLAHQLCYGLMTVMDADYQRMMRKEREDDECEA